MRKKRIVATVHLWQRLHPAVLHHPFDSEFARYTEKISCNGSTSGTVSGTGIVIEDLRRQEVAASCIFYVLFVNATFDHWGKDLYILTACPRVGAPIPRSRRFRRKRSARPAAAAI